jgi:hypothetical protein
MRGSPFIKPIEEGAKTWEKKLHTAQHLVDEWLGLQRTWLYLEPIFSSEDIMRQMPMEARRFQQVDSLWRKVMMDTSEEPKFMSMLERDNLLKKFQQANAKMDEISKGLNEYLEITETRMASNRWDLVNPSSVPAQCSSRNMKALLNEKVKVAPTSCEEDSGNRFPENPMRVGLRVRTRDMFKDPSKMNVGSLFPHIIANQAVKAKSIGTREAKLAAWEKKILDTKEKFDETRARIGDDVSELAAAMAAGNIVGCADVSASMTWVDTEPNRPLDIATGLACFISCIASDKFKDIAFSFTSKPYCFSFKNVDGTPMNVIQRMSAIMKHSGGSTNYEGLHDAMIKLCVDNNVPDGELPVLWIGTDGEFDQMGGMTSWIDGSRNAVSMWDTMHQSIEKKWIRAGYKKVPLIVYHNLHSNSNGVQVDQKYKGVILLGGRSESVLQYILYGEAAEDETKMIEVDGEIVDVKVSSITPYDIFAKAMDHEKYMSVEKVLMASAEWRTVTKQ